MLSTFRPPAREVSASEVAARATDAALHAANAAIKAADAAIKAADAAVRLIDEHEGRTIVVQFAPPRTREKQLPPGEGEPRAIAAFGSARRSGGAPRVLALALIVVGALALIEAGVTLVWQEPVSALYATLRQNHLRGALQKLERTAPTSLERHALSAISEEGQRIAFLAQQLERRARDGGAVGNIRIPRIGISFVIVKGTDTDALKGGPGIFPETRFPGTRGTTAIAGHRTTYLAPFRHIDELHAGSRILLEMPYAHFTYTVVNQRVVAPTDVSAAVANVGYPRLVLSACTPLFTAAKRLLVYARLTSTVAVGAGQPRGGSGQSPAGASVAAARASAPARPSLPAVLESLEPYELSPLV